MFTSKHTRAIVLAAGRGSRFEALSGSTVPKLLQSLHGRAILAHVITHIAETAIDNITIVVGHRADEIRTAMGVEFQYVAQERQLGSGDAVASALRGQGGPGGTLLVMCGDSPLIQSSTLTRLLDLHRSSRAVVTILSSHIPDATGYGRIIRDAECRISAIVEQAACSKDEVSINEVNGGAYVFNEAWLRSAIADLVPNASGEINLTGTLELAVRQSVPVVSMECEPEEILGVNTPDELRIAERLCADFAIEMNKRTELLADGRGITYYDFTAAYPGATKTGEVQATSCPS